MSGKDEAKIQKEEDEVRAHTVQCVDSFYPNRNDGRLKTQEDVSTNEKGKGIVVTKRAKSRILEEGADKHEYLSYRWGPGLAASKLSSGLEQWAGSIGSTAGGSLIGSYGPDQIGQVRSPNEHKMCQQDNGGLKKCSVKLALGILEHMEDGGLSPDGLASSSMGPLEDPT